jgi:hypothetical protein
MDQTQEDQQGNTVSGGLVLVPPEQALRKHTLEKIRPELNLEKWPIWQPAKSKNQPVERIIEREISLPGGNRLSARVEIGFTNRGDLTTEDQRTYYALVQQWEESGRSEQFTFFSLRHLAKRLRKKWGTNVITALTESLIRLRTTPFIWKNSYYDGTTKETIKVLDTFNIVSDLRIIRREQDGVVNREVGYFKFNDFALKNLLTNHTKPVLFDTVLGFHSEIAQMLYTYLDLILADKTHYERRSLELFGDLGLRGKAYRNVSNRKQILDRALKELQGVPLTTGMLNLAALEKTKDDKDYKVVIKKSRRLTPTDRVDLVAGKGQESTREINPPVIAQQSNNTLTSKGRELVALFYTLFHPEVKTVFYNSKAVSQAISLIAMVGSAKARFVLEYSARLAPQTNYRPQTFGGILQYTSRALAQFDDAQRINKQKALIATCSLCDSNGYRHFQDAKNFHRTARLCTHNPTIESRIPLNSQNGPKNASETSDAANVAK